MTEQNEQPTLLPDELLESLKFDSTACRTKVCGVNPHDSVDLPHNSPMKTKRLLGHAPRARS